MGEKSPDLAAIDPVQFARSNLDKANTWSTAFAEMCDFARSEQALFPSKFNIHLDRLNKVLHG
jgi:hypothetical protein